MRFGFQVSISGKLYYAIEQINELGCNCMQIFSRSPRTWHPKKLIQSEAEKFIALKNKADIQPLAVHVPYLINLSTDDAALYKKSIESFKFDLDRAQRLEADYLVTHFGSHKERGEEYGLRRLAEALNEVIAEMNPRPMILLENTVGAGTQLGYTFKHHAAVVDKLEVKEKVGMCLDTAHAYAAGLSLETKEGLDSLLKEIDNLIGLDKLKLIHLNDSFYPKGAKIDRHQHLGDGHMGLKAFERILNHPKLQAAAFILETPRKNPHDDIRNLGIAKKLLKKS